MMELSEEAKAIIEEEERILAQVLASLKFQLSDGELRFRDETRLARDLTSGIVNSTRAEDRHQLASDEAVAHGLSKMRKQQLGQIDKLLAAPYFARIIAEESDPQGRKKTIEYKIGTRANVDCRIIDWRAAPISKLYYEYQEGEEYFEVIQGRDREGVIKLRRRIEIKDGELQRISCSAGNFARENGEWIALDATAKRSGSKRGMLPDVLSLVTKEQFQTITVDADTAVLIQGVAGSGKTTVALYRLAWLVEQAKEKGDGGVPAIIVRSPVLRNYIIKSLPALQLESVPVFSYNDWIRRSLGADAKGAVTDPKAAVPGTVRLKQSMAVLNVLEEYVVSQSARLIDHLRATLDWQNLGSRVETNFGQLSDTLRGGKIAPLPFLEKFDAALGEVNGTGNPLQQNAYDSARQLTEKLRHRLTLYREDLLLILKSFDELLRHDETHLLDRELLVEVWKTTERDFQSGQISLLDYPLLARLAQLKTGSLECLTSLTDAPMARGKYQYLVVDEVQDFSAPELATLIGSVKKISDLTLVGDSAQAVAEHSAFPGWERLRTRWNMGQSLTQLVTLSISYRSTREIMKVADHILGEPRTAPGRAGDLPTWLKCTTEDEGVRGAITWLNEKLDGSPDELVAVLCHSKQTARYVVSLLEPTFRTLARYEEGESFSFEHGIVVTEVSQVKGLEFSTVLLWNPSIQAFPHDVRSQRLLYVAVTRAEESLGIVTWDRPSQYLPQERDRLLSIIEPQEEIVEDDKSGEELFDPYPQVD